MKATHWRIIGRMLLVIAVVVSAIAFRPSPAVSSETAAVTLEGMLEELQLDYIKRGEGFYKIIVSIEDETSMIIATEDMLGGNPDLKLVFLYTRVAQIPEGVQPSRAMLKRMAEINGGLLIGNLSLDGDSVFYNSSFWLGNADSDTLAVELALGHMMRSDARKELLPFIEEE